MSGNQFPSLREVARRRITSIRSGRSGKGDTYALAPKLEVPCSSVLTAVIMV